jgi:hypothetical protein
MDDATAGAEAVEKAVKLSQEMEKIVTLEGFKFKETVMSRDPNPQDGQLCKVLGLDWDTEKNLSGLARRSIQPRLLKNSARTWWASASVRPKWQPVWQMKGKARLTAESLHYGGYGGSMHLCLWPLTNGGRNQLSLIASSSLIRIHKGVTLDPQDPCSWRLLNCTCCHWHRRRSRQKRPA